MTTAIIYHKSDLDGIGSAAIVLQARPGAELYPAEYNQENYEVKDFYGKDVIIVDFTPNLIRAIKDAAKSFTWIDHHKSAMEDFPDLWKDCKGSRDTEYSAIYLAWEYFFPKEEIPLVVELIQDYDIWKFQYGDLTRTFGEYGGMVLRAPTNETWKTLFTTDSTTKSYCELGRVLLDAKIVSVETSFEAVAEKQLWDHKVGVVNSNKDISSLGNYIAEHGYEIGLIWRVGRDGDVIVSLRSIGDIDVSKIAKSYGGGGHKNASGCAIP